MSDTKTYTVELTKKEIKYLDACIELSDLDPQYNVYGVDAEELRKRLLKTLKDKSNNKGVNNG